MSARPRPVTATIKHGMKAPATLPPRARLEDTGDSTLSLISINAHDSVQSLDEPSSHASSGDTPSERPSTAPTFSQTEMVSDHRPRVPQKHTGLSAWEQWLVQKEALLRQKLKDDLRQQREKREAEKKKKREQAEKERRAEQDRQRWLREKQAEERLRAAESVREARVHLQKEEQEKRLTEEKSREKFSSWLSDKRREVEERKRHEKEKKMEEEKEKEEKRKKNEEAYQKWLKKNKQRPKSAPPFSYGYTGDGKLKKYHDTCAYPEPAYVNPVPWRGPDIPRYETDRIAGKAAKTRNKTKKYRWNPDKYY